MTHSEADDEADVSFIESEDGRRAPPAATHATVEFYPQVWAGDHPLTGDPFTYRVPVEDILKEDGTVLEDASNESDSIRDHPNAPEKVRKWQGPFFVKISALHSDRLPVVE